MTKRKIVTQMGSYGSSSATETEQTPLTTEVIDIKYKRKLVSYHELPEWQKDNDYIIHGYVRETNSFKHCFHSLFYLHNETVNIFTHLLPGAIFPLLCVLCIPLIFANDNYVVSLPTFLAKIPEFPNTDESDRYIFALFFAGFIGCLSCSGIYHTIKAHSSNVSCVGSQLDYAGILLLIGTSLVGIVHYALVDTPRIKNVFISLISVVGLASLVLTWNPNFKTPAWRPIRTSVFVLFSFTGLIPICYGLWVHDFAIVARRAGLKYVGLEGLSYLSGAALYAGRFPERVSPGKFDFFGHSHQIFHILVVAGAYWHFRGLVQAYIVAKTETLGAM